MLIVEDGTGLANAESFISVADATAYHLARGNDAWAAIATDTIREQLLRKATDYMQGQYREIWTGYMLKPTQALAWPRYYVPIKGYALVGIGSATGFGAYWPSNAVPVIVANACAELALKALTLTLAADIERVTIREKIGPIEVDYMPGSLPFVRYRAIDNMLQAFFSGSAGSTKVVRS